MAADPGADRHEMLLKAFREPPTGRLPSRVAASSEGPPGSRVRMESKGNIAWKNRVKNTFNYF